MKFYVYALTDPRDGEPFYIGKGQKRRAWQHEIDAAKGERGPRFDRIRDLASEGLKPTIEILRRFEDEADAYAHEAELIRRGRRKLLNVAHGGIGPLSGPGSFTDERTVARAIGLFVRRTENFTKPHPACWFHDGPKPLPGAVVDMAKAQLKRLLDKFGAEWFERETGVSFA